MSQYFQIHPDNPQIRLIKQAIGIIEKGGVVIYPTDSTYAVGCHLGDKKALDRIRQLRHLEQQHPFTLLCRDLSDLGTYAQVSNRAYRILKALTPGPFTFILEGSREVPRRLLDEKRKTIGLRVPKHPIVQALLDELGQPLMSTTLVMPGEDLPLWDPEDMREALEDHVDLIIDGGSCGLEPTTIIDLTSEIGTLLRQGLGDASQFF
jgi:tRNA threonylcarbamoyl adenosine modification protein (Sua5/YciO/YrdC/YwlC family)